MITSKVSLRLVDIGVGIALTGFIYGILACGLLAKNELNLRILIGFGCLFGLGLIIAGVSFAIMRARQREIPIKEET